MQSDILLRWFGVAGIELTHKNQVLAIDPFFTRPPFWNILWGHPHSKHLLAARHLSRCDYILVSHSHYDHLMDVPAIASYTGAAIYGSQNTCQIASLLGLPQEQVYEVSSGSRLQLGEFVVEIQPTEHIRTPVDRWINGALPDGLQPPLRLRDYRMDCCFAFLVQVGGLRILFNQCSLPADVLIFAPLRKMGAYRSLLQAVQPQVVIPIHWDNFFRPLDAPLRPLPHLPKFLWPGLNSHHPKDFKHQVEALAPGVKACLPDLFEPIKLNELISTTSGIETRSSIQE